MCGILISVNITLGFKSFISFIAFLGSVAVPTILKQPVLIIRSVVEAMQCGSSSTI
jgi:hypothetical protein